MKLTKLNILLGVLLFVQAMAMAQLSDKDKQQANEEKIKSLISRLDNFTEAESQPTPHDYDSLVNLVAIYKLQNDILHLEVDILKNHGGDLSEADSSEVNQLSDLANELQARESQHNGGSSVANTNTINSSEDTYTTTEITQITKTTATGNSARLQKELEEIKAYQAEMDKKLDRLYSALENMNAVNPQAAAASGYQNRATINTNGDGFDSYSNQDNYLGYDGGKLPSLKSLDAFIEHPENMPGYAFIVVEAQNAERKIIVAHKRAAKGGINTKIMLNKDKDWYYLVLPSKYSDEDSQAALQQIRAHRLDAWRYIL